MAWRGSFSRSLISTARSSAFRSSPPSISGASRLRPPPFSAARPQTRRFSFSNPRTLGELGCAQSLMPLHSMSAGPLLTSHLAVNVRACCELYHGISPDRKQKIEVEVSSVALGLKHLVANFVAFCTWLDIPSTRYLNILLDERIKCC